MTSPLAAPQLVAGAGAASGGQEIFVISDLHIGGALAPQADLASATDAATTTAARGFRINSRVDRLCAFIGEVGRRRRTRNRPIELVINGDFVDFLAEADPVDQRHHAFVGDAQRALQVFEAIVARDRPLFDALRQLLADGVALTLLLGNHDLELSLPPVRRRLEELLGMPTAGTLRFIYDGEAHVVGDVLIEHGNRYDGWNVVDHDRLRRHRSAASRRQPLAPGDGFTPPAGSLLVERVMNPIKRDYPFIDLLKPETGAALPLLLALEPSLAGVVNAIEALRLRQQAARHGPAAPGLPAQPGDIAGGAPAATATAATAATGLDALQHLLATSLGDAGSAALLQLADRAAAARRADLGAIAGGPLERALSFMRLRTGDALAARLQVLMGALRALRDDRSFDRMVETEACYLDAAEALGRNGFAVVVFGHTHLAKSLPLQTSGARYINTGTWADLLRVPDSIIAGPAALAQAQLAEFAQALQQQRFGPYLDYRPTYAHIAVDAAGRAQQATLRDYIAGTVETL